MSVFRIRHSMYGYKYVCDVLYIKMSDVAQKHIQLLILNHKINCDLSGQTDVSTVAPPRDLIVCDSPLINSVRALFSPLQLDWELWNVTFCSEALSAARDSLRSERLVRVGVLKRGEGAGQEDRRRLKGKERRGQNRMRKGEEQ